MNTVAIIGNLGKNPEVRSTNGGTPVTRFSIAWDEIYLTAAGEKRERTHWFDVVTFAGLAKSCSHLTNGARVAVSGRLSQNTWEKDGEKHSRVEVVAERVDFLSPKKTSDSPATEEHAIEVGGEDLEPPKPKTRRGRK